MEPIQYKGAVQRGTGDRAQAKRNVQVYQRVRLII